MHIMKYQNFINSQLNNKNVYINDEIRAHDILSIRIKNNTIESVKFSRVHPQRKEQFLALITDVLTQHTLSDGYVNINVEDHPKKGVLNFCRLVGNHSGFLIPNHRFADNDISISNNTPHISKHDDVVRFFVDQNAAHSFKYKIPKVFANGVLAYGVRKQFVIYALDNPDVCDFYAYKHPTHKYGGQGFDAATLHRILKDGKGGEVTQPFEASNQYKYVLYLEGNTLSDRRRLILMLNSVPIVLKSKWEEFYTHALIPHEHYIPCERVADLQGIVKRLESEPDKSMAIIENNRRFVRDMLSYVDVTNYTAALLNGLLTTTTTNS